MDAVNRQLQADIKLARAELIRAGIPGGPVTCGCGGPLIREGDPWTTAHRLKLAAWQPFSFGGGIMGLALHELIDEGIFRRDQQTLKLRLRLSHPKVRRIRNRL